MTLKIVFFHRSGRLAAAICISRAHQLSKHGGIWPLVLREQKSSAFSLLIFQIASVSFSPSCVCSVCSVDVRSGNVTLLGVLWFTEGRICIEIDR